MNHRAAIPLLRTAREAWQSESRWETYLAIVVGVAAIFLLAREAWRLKGLWTDKN